VAKLAGVSVGTVSNVMNQPEIVATKTAERVRRAIDELGYVRNNAARQLRSGSSRSVGMIVLDVRNPFFTDVARGAEDELVSRQRSLLLANSAEDPARELMHLAMFEEQRVDGLLIFPIGDILPRLNQMRARGIAVVLVDRLAASKHFTSVAVDDVHGGRLATEHLLGLGRNRLAFVGGPRGIEQVRNRHAGAVAAVEANGAGTLMAYEVEAMNTQAARALGETIAAFPANQQPQGIFAANDLIALGLLQAFTQAGIMVPDDVALIGYDDIEFAASAAIPLSSIRQPARQMGRRAAELLLDEMDKGPTDAREHIVFDPMLVARASTQGWGPAGRNGSTTSRSVAEGAADL
jgi:LacI family transcriptional regulator